MTHLLSIIVKSKSSFKKQKALLLWNICEKNTKIFNIYIFWNLMKGEFSNIFKTFKEDNLGF